MRKKKRRLRRRNKEDALREEEAEDADAEEEERTVCQPDADAAVVARVRAKVVVHQLHQPVHPDQVADQRDKVE